MAGVSQEHIKVKNEQLARAIIKNGGDRKKAWQEVHKNCKSGGSASVSMHRYLNKHHEVIEKVNEYVEKYGINLDYWAKKIKKLSNAKKPHNVNDTYIMTNDNQTQANMCKIGLKLNGFDTESYNNLNNSNNNQINIYNSDNNNIMSDRLGKIEDILQGVVNTNDGENNINNANNDMSEAEIIE